MSVNRLRFPRRTIVKTRDTDRRGHMRSLSISGACLFMVPPRLNGSAQATGPANPRAEQTPPPLDQQRNSCPYRARVAREMSLMSAAHSGKVARIDFIKTGFVGSRKRAGPTCPFRWAKSRFASADGGHGFARGLGSHMQRVPSRLIAFQRTPLLRIRFPRRDDVRQLACRHHRPGAPNRL
jgi:hypothetical protein